MATGSKQVRIWAEASGIQPSNPGRTPPISSPAQNSAHHRIVI
eukprot:CAMPEP_0178512862 /NCGR_PEP_ID=MMETSP0696-20121128/23142_1 /TAXON_ID=265572 /ORGANISM="Extubocellulus spinifer, Strain CCMP396" /LENGTH=42 /DNA_ID= /DNA_START= /DNA_END= /DNA_ORIENTATION=